MAEWKTFVIITAFWFFFQILTTSFLSQVLCFNFLLHFPFSLAIDPQAKETIPPSNSGVSYKLCSISEQRNGQVWCGQYSRRQLTTCSGHPKPVLKQFFFSFWAPRLSWYTTVYNNTETFIYRDIFRGNKLNSLVYPCTGNIHRKCPTQRSWGKAGREHEGLLGTTAHFSLHSKGSSLSLEEDMAAHKESLAFHRQ